jgi:hypothetical protein
MDTTLEEENLRRLWTSQLYKEHQEISWYHRAGLKPVVIQVIEMAGVWGKWDPFFRTISLNAKLIREHSWDVVLEVLKHEMAHQYVTDHDFNSYDTDHGPAFQKACQKLGVSPWASRAGGKIPDVIPSIRERVLSAEDQRLLERVEKLLSLAQSSNEHEALLAMERVRELYAKHNLDRIRWSKDEDSMDSLFFCRKKKRTEPTEAKILAILNDHFRVKVIHTHLFDAKACERFKAAEILGRRENILMAEFVYHFLHQQCESLWMSYQERTRCAALMRRSYQLGVLSGFDEKLIKADSIDIMVAHRSAVAESEVKSLQKIERSACEEFVGMRYPRISKKSWGGGRVDQGAFTSGQSEGRQLNLNKPLKSHSGFGGYLK